MGLESVEDYGVEDSSQRRPRSCYTRGKSFLRRKISRDDSHTGDKKTAASNPDADALCQHDLPVLGANGRHHHTEYDQERTSCYERPEVSCIVQRTCPDADQKEEVRLDGSDPGDI